MDFGNPERTQKVGTDLSVCPQEEVIIATGRDVVPLPVVSLLHRLPRVAKSELDVATLFATAWRQAFGRRHLTTRSGRCAGELVGKNVNEQVRVVCEIEELGPDLNLMPFPGHVEVL